MYGKEKPTASVITGGLLIVLMRKWNDGCSAFRKKGYCDYGSTSLLAARKLAKAGYEVYTVVGGIHAIKEYEARNGRDNN